MTIAFWCVLIAALLPIIWTSIAKSGGDYGDEANHSPRDYLKNVEGWRKRADYAQQNALEAFPPFAAAVIIAHYLGLAVSTINIIAVLFIFFRILHGVCYIKDLATLRSVVWLGGLACVIALFVLSAL